MASSACLRISPRKIRKFHDEILGEFLEGVEFLYAQRLYLLDAPEFKWRDIGSGEARVEPYLDGLMVGGEQALELCKEAIGGQPGEFHAACRILRRHEQLDRLLSALKEGDKKSPEHALAGAYALCLEPAGEWQKELMQSAMRAGAAPRAFAKFAGYARLPVRNWLHKMLKDRDAAPIALTALGRLKPDPASVEVMRPMLASDDPTARTAAAISLLRSGDGKVIDDCERAVERGELWGALPVALGGKPKSIRSLLGMWKGLDRADPKNADYVDAVAVSGTVAGVDILLDAVGHEMLSAAAARGLQRLTGVEIAKPERPADDELFPNELAAKQDKPADSLEAQSLEAQLQQLWRTWWNENGARFDAKSRWIFGKPASATALVACLEAPKLPRRQRDLAYDEIVIRHDATQRFETDFPVAEQEHAIATLKKWANESAG